MNRLLIVFGCLFTAIWTGVACLTKGFSPEIVRRLDLWTFKRFSDFIHKTSNGFYYDVRNHDMPTEVFLFFFFLAFIMYWVLIHLIKEHAPQKFSLWIIFSFAVVFRLIMLPTEPIHENDFYRYIWDGRTINNGVNPFKYAPSDLYMYANGYTKDYFDPQYRVILKARDFNANDHKNIKKLLTQYEKAPVMFERIGHWQVPTIYPPVAQWIFAFITSIFGNSIYWFKFMLVVFDLGVIVLIILLLKHVNLNPAFSIIYAWSPLTLKEVPNSAHYDPIAVFFTLLAILCSFKSKGVGAYGVLALAALSKFFSGLLLPLFLKPFHLRYLFIFSAIIFGLYLPFFLWDETGWDVFRGLNTYNERWSYNASFYAVVYRLLEQFAPAAWMKNHFFPKAVVGGIYVLILLMITRRQPENQLDFLKKCFFILGLLFIMNPVGDPWYFLWVLPFLCFFPSRPWILLSGLLILSYLNFQSHYAVIKAEIWGIPLLSWIIYVPFYIYWTGESLRRE